MVRTVFLKLLAAAGILAAGPASAQVQTIDPNQAGQYQSQQQAPSEAQPAPEESEFQPADPSSQENAPAPNIAPQSTEPSDAAKRANDAIAGRSVPRKDVFTAAEGVFGKGAAGLAELLENLLKKQGEPSAYITGREAGGAFIVGARYGSGTLHHQVEGDRPVYWTGPSIGFDAGADANKVFVLVYNLHDSQRLFRKYPAAEGNAYALGGFTASYLRRGDVVLIPIRLGVGLRLGVNGGYVRFTEKNRWLPF